MQHRQRPVSHDKFGRPLQLGEVLWDSTETPWSGFQFGITRLANCGQFGETISAFPHVTMCISGLSNMEMQAGKTEDRAVSTMGALELSSRGFGYDVFSWYGSSDIVSVELDMARIGAALEPQKFVSELSIVHQFLIRDPRIASLLLNMIEEAKAGCPTGKIYSESLSAALAALVLSRYTADEKEQKQKKARLSAAQIQKVRDYVHAHMSNNIGLNELAGVLHLSAPNFARLFKNATEITPYQYVLRERISRSITLLSFGRISVSEVALATGFADQSHFSKIFKKCTTSTPRQYQLRQHHIQG